MAQFKVGDNWAESDAGTVTFGAGSDQFATWSLSAFSQDDGANGNFSSGDMYSWDTTTPLSTAMEVSLDGSNYASLPTGVATTASTSTYSNFNVYAYQSVTKTDVLNGSGTYWMIINLMATVTP
jgi:hypothetical protein